MNPWLYLILGLLCAAVGGELFIRGAVGVASWLRVPKGIIGATVAAFATSSPELAVAVSAARAGKPEIALGDALGANVVNIALILGIALAMGAIRAPRGSVKRDFPVAAIAPILTLLLIADGVLSQLDALALFALFLGWLILSLIEARKEADATEEVLGIKSRFQAVAFCLAGLLLLMLAGQFIVNGAKGIGDMLGMDEFVVGATLVAVGTTFPELITVVLSRLRGHEEVGLGAVLGSCVFNGLVVVPVAAIIAPIRVEVLDVAVGLGFGVALLAATYPPKSGMIARQRSALLLAGFVAYMIAMLQR